MQALLIKFDGAVKFVDTPYRSTRNYGGPEQVIRFAVHSSPHPWPAPGAAIDESLETRVEEYELLTFTHNTNIAIYEQRR